jgi:hypothetical protein
VIYFRVYKSQSPVIEPAIETAGRRRAWVCGPPARCGTRNLDGKALELKGRESGIPEGIGAGFSGRGEQGMLQNCRAQMVACCGRQTPSPRPTG